MNHQPIVYLVDDDQSIRKALALALGRKGLHVKAFASADSFLHAYSRSQPGCLVLDVKMPEMSGLELQQVLAEKQIRVPIIFITGHGDVHTASKAFKAGAIDFLEKPFDQHTLLKCIKDALALDTRQRDEDSKNKTIQSRFSHLTAREKQVMATLVTGKASLSNKQVANKLGISHRTVETHRRAVMGKMQATSLTELVEMAKICTANISSSHRQTSFDM